MDATTAKGVLIDGRKLLAMRRLQLVTQEEMAHEAGLSARGVQRIETSPCVRIRLATARSLAAFFKMDVPTFLRRLRPAAAATAA